VPEGLSAKLLGPICASARASRRASFADADLADAGLIFATASRLSAAGR